MSLAQCKPYPDENRPVHPQRSPFLRAVWGLATALLLFVLAPAPAGAALPTAAIRYTAPPECPGASTFLSLLEDRTAGTWRFRAGDGAPGLVVEIRSSTVGNASGKIGRVRWAGRADEGAREIAATDCHDLVQALALSTALSLDGDQSDPAAAPGTTAIAKQAMLPVPQHASWIVGGGVLTTFVLPSQPMPQALLFVENARRSWPTGLGFHRPDVRLAISYARNDLFGADRARFALASASLTVCPVGLGLRETATLRLCAAGEMGMLSGEGIAINSPETNRFLWAAGGAVMRLRWAPGRRFAVEAQVGVAAPLERSTFVFEMPRVEVARVGALVASGGLMAGFAIP